MSAILAEFGVELRTLREAGIALEVDEWGTTFAQNAALKALNYAREAGGVAIADDSGIAVAALKGAPGVYSARFAGEHASDAQNNQKLQEELAGVPPERRQACYHCMIALCARPDSNDPRIARLRTQMPPAPYTHFEALEEGAWELAAADTHRLAEHAQPMHLWLFEGQWHGRVADEARGHGGFGYDPWVVLPCGRHVAELPDVEKNRLSHRAKALQKLHAALV